MRVGVPGEWWFCPLSPFLFISLYFFIFTVVDGRQAHGGRGLAGAAAQGDEGGGRGGGEAGGEG